MTIFAIFVNIASLGLRPSIFRFHGIYKQEQPDKEKSLFSTLFLTTLISSLSIAISVSFCTLMLSKYFKFAVNIMDIVSFSAILIIIRTITSLIQNHLRILDKPHYYAVVSITVKYITLGIALFMVLYLKMGLIGLYLAYLFSEGAICTILFIIYRVNMGKKLYYFSKPIFKETFQYGFPLMLMNFTGLINSQGNKFIIAPLMGSAAVGIYSIGQMLCSYIEAFLSTPLRMAFMPVFMNLWAEKGEKETSDFLSNFFRIYFFLAIPIMFGLTAISKNLIIFVASEKFVESAVVVPYLIVAILLGGVSFAFYGGLYLAKNTMTMFRISIVMSILNIILNLILITWWGLKGAALATLLTSIVSIIIGFYYSSKYIKVKFPVFPIFKYVLCGFIMFVIVKLLDRVYKSEFVILLVQVITGTIIYLILIIFWDRSIREIVKNYYRKVSKSLKPNYIDE